jgi:putative transposase
VVQIKDLTEVTLADLWREVKEEEDWWGDLNAQTLQMVKRLLESTMEQEFMEQLRAGPYKRTELRRGYRNGYRERSLLTRLGSATLRVPRDRAGAYQTALLERYQRREESVTALIRDSFLAGVSTRRVGEVVGKMLGEAPSAQLVSRVARSLDAEVERYRSRSLADHYQYLFLDGVTMKVKALPRAKKRLVLTAYGITPEGQREIIHYRQAAAEGETHWEAFLRDLYARGLEGKALQLIVTDGNPGLHRALETVYPYVPRQRCWAHKLRNVAARLPRSHQKACLDEARTIYQSPNRRQGRRAFWTWAHTWRSVAPEAVACVEKDLEELLAFLECPEAHRRKIRTTNVIERAFREVRRRTRPMSCFQNGASVDRIMYSVFFHLNHSWTGKPLGEFTHSS